MGLRATLLMLAAAVAATSMAATQLTAAVVPAAGILMNRSARKVVPEPKERAGRHWIGAEHGAGKRQWARRPARDGVRGHHPHGGDGLVQQQQQGEGRRPTAPSGLGHEPGGGHVAVVLPGWLLRPRVEDFDEDISAWDVAT